MPVTDEYGEVMPDVTGFVQRTDDERMVIAEQLRQLGVGSPVMQVRSQSQIIQHYVVRDNYRMVRLTHDHLADNATVAAWRQRYFTALTVPARVSINAWEICVRQQAVSTGWEYAAAFAEQLHCTLFVRRGVEDCSSKLLSEFFPKLLKQLSTLTRISDMPAEWPPVHATIHEQVWKDDSSPGVGIQVCH
jgi:hypothetical protein